MRHVRIALVLAPGARPGTGPTPLGWVAHGAVFDHHFVKPIGQAVVEELVKSAAAKKEQARPTPSYRPLPVRAAVSSPVLGCDVPPLQGDLRTSTKSKPA